jgi:hypothetical protein
VPDMVIGTRKFTTASHAVEDFVACERENHLRAVHVYVRVCVHVCVCMFVTLSKHDTSQSQGQHFLLPGWHLLQGCELCHHSWETAS